MRDCRKEPDELSRRGAGMAASNGVSISTTSAASGRRAADSSQHAMITCQEGTNGKQRMHSYGGGRAVDLSRVCGGAKAEAQVRGWGAI